MKKPVIIIAHIIILIILFIYTPCLAKNQTPQTDLDRGRSRLIKSDYTGSLKYFESYLNSCKGKKDINGQARAHLWMGRRFLELRLFDKSIKQLEESKKLFQSANNGTGVLKANIVLAEASFHTGLIRKARLLTEESEKMINKDTPTALRIDFYLVRGLIMQKYRKIDLSIKNYEAAQKMASKIKDKDREILALRGLTLVYARDEKYEKANETCSRAIEMAMETDRPYLQALTQETDGLIKQGKAMYREALKSYIGAQVLYRSSGNPGKEAEIFIELSDIYRILNDRDKSRKFMEKALEVYKKSNNIPGWLKASRTYRFILSRMGDTEGIKKYGREMMELAESLSYPPYKAEAYFHLGKFLCRTKRDYREASRALGISASLFRRIGDKKQEIRSLMELGWALGNYGKYDEAQKAFRKALNMRISMGKADKYEDFDFYFNSNVGEINRLMGLVYYMQSNHQAAIKKFQKALEYDISMNRYDNRAFNYYYIIQSAIAIYDIDMAWKSMKDAFRDIPKVKNPTHRATHYNLIVGALLSGQRNKRKFSGSGKEFELEDTISSMLMDRIRKDPEIYLAIHQGYRDWIEGAVKEKSRSWEILAHISYAQFNLLDEKYSEARNQYEMALEIARKIKSPFHEGLIYLYISELLLVRGKYKEALNIKEKKLEIYKGMGDVLHQITTLIGIAMIRTETGDHEGALKAYNEAHLLANKEKYEGLLVWIVPGKAGSLMNLDKLDESLKTYQQALILTKKFRNRRLEAEALADMANIYARKNMIERAIKKYQSSFKKYEKMANIYGMRDVVLQYGELLQKKNRDKEALKLYIGVLNKIIKSWESTPKELGQVQLKKGSKTMLLFERVINLFLKTGKNKEALKYLELSRSAELVGSLNLGDIKLKDKKMRQLLNKVRTSRRKMALIEKEIGDVQNQKRKQSLGRILASTRKEFFVTINEIKSKNPDFEQLLSVRGTDLAALQKIIPGDTLLIEYYPSNDALYIFVVTDKSLKIQKVNISRKRLYSVVRKYREQISRPTGKDIPAGLERNRNLLYSMLLEPIEKNIRKKDKIVAIPGGLLWYLPLETLGPEGGKLLVEEKAVSYLSSADILRLVQKKMKMAGEDGKLLALGAPSGVNLPYSGEEVRQIASIFPKSKVFTGNKATRKMFFENAPDYSIVHIATHSGLNRQNVNKSYIQLAGKDGKLYLGDIYGISLKSSSLVILSSCESSLGEDNPGREFASLSSAFTTAGASSVIASMWKVDDRATALLFVEFYKNLKSGKTRAESLRQAKLKLIRNPKTAHPFYWGGFVLMGDWR